jgi:hypothetical protein
LRVIIPNTMKTLLIAACCTVFLAGSALAGRVGVYFNSGGYGCAPRYYAPPVCYAPRVVNYCAPAAVYYRTAPVYYYSSAPVIYAPVRTRVYQAPIVTGAVTVSPVAFGWRR